MIDMQALEEIRRAKIPPGCEAWARSPVADPGPGGDDLDDDERPSSARNGHRAARRSAYRGVLWHATSSRWRGAFYPPGARYPRYRGYHATEEDAARAADSLAREYGADKAKLNFPDEEPNP